MEFLGGLVNSHFIKTIALVSAIAFSASGALAAPLAPGKPAGVKAAQMEGKEWLVFGAIAAAGIAVAVASAGGSHDQVTPPPFTVVTPGTQ